MTKQCASCAYWAIGTHDYMQGLCAVKEVPTWYDDACDKWREAPKDIEGEEVE
jgi:hypothetical protein